MDELSLLKGTPPVGPVVPVSQPTLPDFDTYVGHLRDVFATRQITNHRWVGELEARAAEYLGCAEVVALANATSGLILLARLLGMKGEVCLPTFTFPATFHALLWNGLKARLVDSDPDDFNISPESLERALAQGAGGVVPVYIFGNSPDWDRLTPILRQRGLPCYSDAAHAFGTRWSGVMAGNFADAEVFSFAPTKVTVSGEGGLVATNRPELARELRVARNYGNPGDYDCVLAGLNARQSELHALLGALSLGGTEAAIGRRHLLVDRYREELGDVPGLSFQRIDPRCRTTYNYVAVRLRPEEYGLNNREAQALLSREGIQSKIYFAPPLHRQSRFSAHFEGQGPFPGAEAILATVLCLPLYTHMEEATVARVAAVLRAGHTRAGEVRRALERERDTGAGSPLPGATH